MMSDQDSELGKCENVIDFGERNASSSSTKKAVHVKWAGKTIALGTYMNKEADEICARAKDLTRTWRSTMRPKPSRKWVMLELEKLQIRKVSSRLGRKCRKEESSDEEDDIDDGEDEKPLTVCSGGGEPTQALENGCRHYPSLENSTACGMASSYSENSDKRQMQGALSSENDNDKMNEDIKRLINGLGLLPPDPEIQNNNPGSNPMQGGYSRPSNSRFHYEMLKLHYMNLLTEIQETKLLMNLFEQQELQKHIDKHQYPGNQMQNQFQMSIPEHLQRTQQNLLTNERIEKSSMNTSALGPAGTESIEMQNLLRQQQSIAMSMHQQSPSYPAQSQQPPLKKGEEHCEENGGRQESHVDKLRRDIAKLQRQADELAAIDRKSVV